MSTSFRSFRFSGLAGALAALWLCGAGAAWAGDGADLGSLQALLSDPNFGLCKIFNMTTCPQVPTVTQGVLEVAALGNNLPEMVRAQNSIPPGSSVTAGNAATAPYFPNFLPISFPLPAESTTSTTVSELLATLTPLGFASQKSGTAVARQLYDPKADAFLYAVGVSSSGFPGPSGLTDPDTVFFVYDDLFRVAQTFVKGQIVAKFSFPLTVLTVLNGNSTETPVMTTLEITSCANGLASCFNANAVGGIGTAQNPIPASQLGIQFAFVFSGSPTFTQKHAIFEVAVPLLVTGACSPTACPPAPNTDPAYFYSLHNPGPPTKTNPVNTGVYTTFLFDDANGILPQGASIGLAPTAAPLGPPPAIGASSTFALCAALPDNSNGPGARLRPAVGAYYAIATSGETLLSAPLASVSTSVCPAL